MNYTNSSGNTLTAGGSCLAKPGSKLNKRGRQLIVHLVLVKDVEEYKPGGFIPLDVNENNVLMLLDGVAYLFETNVRDVVLGYYCSRKRVQEKYDRLYNVKSRTMMRALRKLKERRGKEDIR